jgi:hypothetical protein
MPGAYARIMDVESSKDRAAADGICNIDKTYARECQATTCGERAAPLKCGINLMKN